MPREGSADKLLFFDRMPAMLPVYLALESRLREKYPDIITIGYERGLSMLDILIKNGKIIDGKNAAPQAASMVRAIFLSGCCTL